MNKRLDAQTDMYSLGATFYRMVTGQAPFTGVSRSEIMRLHVLAKPIPPIKLAEGLPKPLSNLIEKMLAKKQTERPESMTRLVADLRLIYSGKVAIVDQQPRVDPSALRGIQSTRAAKKSPAKKPRVPAELMLVIGLLVVLAVVVTLMILR